MIPNISATIDTFNAPAQTSDQSIPLEGFNNEVGKIIPGFSFKKEQFESESITISLFKKNLYLINNYQNFYNYVFRLKLLKK